MRGLRAALAAAVLLHADSVPLPRFYTRADEFGAAAAAALAPCGAAARLQHDSGLLEVTIRTGNAVAHTVGHEHPQAPVRAMLVFGEHSRELVPPELALRLMTDACHLQHARDAASDGVALPRFAGVSGDAAAASTGAAAANAAVYAAAVDYLVSQPFALKLVPLANPWGRRQVEQGDYCRRTNAAAVDLNRNWDSHWHKPAADTMQTVTLALRPSVSRKRKPCVPS